VNTTGSTDAQWMSTDPSTVERAQFEPLLLRPSEAALMLGISRSKLYELLAAEEIPVVRIGRCVRIPTTALRAWVEAQSGRS
jgi:excisionase family DNA binding protein